jgi:phosphonoacetaldehyde hydrolase
MFTYQRCYRGKLQAVILDWSGTTVDYGCVAPAKVFIEVFAEQGVDITLSEARTPMGTFKRDHIRAITRMSRVAEHWQQVHGRAPNEHDVDHMYTAFTPKQIAVITEYSELIPGVEEAVQVLRARGLKIGSCTGFTQEMMKPLLPEVAKQGYTPDALVCPDDVGGGRPQPWMCFENMRRLGVYPSEAVVKIGDTPVDVQEGLNAGMWTIGLAKTGNEVGLALDTWQTLAPEAQSQKLATAYNRLRQAGAHYVVDSLADVVPILDTIEARLAKGEKP